MSKYCHLCASLDCSVSIAIVYINTKEGLWVSVSPESRPPLRPSTNPPMWTLCEGFDQGGRGGTPVKLTEAELYRAHSLWKPCCSVGDEHSWLMPIKLKGNPRPSDPQSDALTTALRGPVGGWLLVLTDFLCFCSTCISSLVYKYLWHTPLMLIVIVYRLLPGTKWQQSQYCFHDFLSVCLENKPWHSFMLYSLTWKHVLFHPSLNLPHHSQLVLISRTNLLLYINMLSLMSVDVLDHTSADHFKLWSVHLQPMTNSQASLCSVKALALF